MAYNDVFMLICIIAVLTMLWIFVRSLWLMSTTRAVTTAATPTVSTSGASTS